MARTTVSSQTKSTCFAPGRIITGNDAPTEDELVALARARLPRGHRHDSSAFAAVLVARGTCFRNSGPIAARLEAWVAGPYPPDDGRGARGAPGSVWRVADQFGDTEYVWINDSGGRHAGRREMAL